MIALEVFVQGKFITFRESLVYFEFKFDFTVRRVPALRDNQLQASNSNLLRDKL